MDGRHSRSSFAPCMAASSFPFSAKAARSVWSRPDPSLKQDKALF